MKVCSDDLIQNITLIGAIDTKQRVHDKSAPRLHEANGLSEKAMMYSKIAIQLEPDHFNDLINISYIKKKWANLINIWWIFIKEFKKLMN